MREKKFNFLYDNEDDMKKIPIEDSNLGYLIEQPTLTFPGIKGNSASDPIKLQFKN